MGRAKVATRPAQAGYLEPSTGAGGDAGAGGPYTIAGIFGKAAPDPVVMTGGPSDNYLDIGGYSFGIAPMSGVTTVDGHGPVAPEAHIPHAKNLARPMHSEAFWILLLAIAALGIFSAAGSLRLGPVHFGATVGSKK